MRKPFCMIILCLLVIATPAFAQKTITLSLTDNQNPPGTRHFCYHRMTDATYGPEDRVDLGTQMTYDWVLEVPALGTHYFACTAYAPDGSAILESPFSNEYSWTNMPVAPTITGTVAAVTRKEAALLATTSTPARTILEYTPEGSPNTKAVTGNSTPALNHSVILTKLRPHTSYFYRWTAIDEAGQVVTLTGIFQTL